jgi:hypothetical protein
VAFDGPVVAVTSEDGLGERLVRSHVYRRVLTTIAAVPG